jgi:glycosyltransferase involved in cell wall biosynthesis
VPVVGLTAPGPAREVLGERLARVLENPSDLTSPLRREEYSIRLRRAALLEHSVVAWRQRVAAAAGVDYDAYPSVSILLATKRPHQLEFALKQIAKQQGADLELVLAAHGWTPDPERVRALLGDIPVTILSIEQETSFGDVLNAAAAAASGELVLKFDDDDWYGPDVVSDLLLARNYSGADLVGSTAEFAFLEPMWRMIRRNDEAEREATFVAGGTMMLDRSTLHSLGGFRSVHKYVDASLLASAHAAGALVYRTHGLGYVLRRSAGGHTWQADLDYFLNPKRIADQWEGFVTSELLVLADDELPQRDRGEVS